MLPRGNRLIGKSNFDRVLKKGKVLQFPCLGLVFLKEGDNLSSRFGFIISNKISKKAVERNRIRRILREAIRENLPTMPPGFLFVILAKRSILEKSATEIKKEVVEAIRKI